MKVEVALDISKKETAREYGAKLLFALLTLAFLWSSGGGDPVLFWSRQPGLTLLVGSGVLLWARYLAPTTWTQLKAKPSQDEVFFALKWGSAWALLMGGLLTIGVLLVPASPWVSWDFLEASTISRGLLGFSFLLVTSYFLEFFLRGYLSESWGRGSVAFLEAVTIGVGLQSGLPFVMLLPMIFVWHRIAIRRGTRSAALTRVVWTLEVCVIAALLASRSA
jgi:hypothetical protein